MKQESPQTTPPKTGLASVAEELSRLERMTVAELTHRYVEEFRKPPRTRHRLWLLRTLAFRLQERRFGGLSGAARKRLDELIAEIELPAPLTAASAPARTRKRSSRSARVQTAPDAATEARAQSTRDPNDALRPGTVINKVWRDRVLRLVVRDDGSFELEGVVHRSLSAAAKAVTDQHWNGRLFWFGRRKANA